jgi:serine/threonine protein kinase
MSEIQSTQVIDRENETPVQKPIEIPGYTLESRLGVGGYGEVWKAIGPGGLAKAVKILFGKMDGPQADAELKSLERMRDLRHPFLLSIERIQVVEGRLVVVTELADGCLEKRFQTLRADGQRGVPREELLGYLRDSADALDFMLEEHGLQHLDIKPENLLLQGKHVKVGDFGLAKDVNVTNMSLVGGFTPLYAPPEIFEGQPTRTSDQYSLAIVYQTMLTGVPPFSGRTAAQLTAQHLRSTPDLSSLQPIDRPVIARALSKNPNARFPNCRQFVDELTKRRNSRVRSKVQAAPLEPQATKRLSAASMAAPDELRLVETEPLPPSPPTQTAMYRPTLYVGVGGLGGITLQGIRKRFVDAHGDCPATAFPMLYLDTDRKAIASRIGDQQTVGLSESELLGIPLRTSTAYRADENLKLKWLSRRWLFNLPRSGEVEGIRPLGRLALMDHEAAIRNRLQTTIKHALTDESIVATRQDINLPIQASCLDVVVVGSTAGGTGSGAILDVGGIIRDVLQDLDIGMTNIIGFLVHATSSQREVGDIQEANTISCLKELCHYRTPGLEESNPFDHTYVIQLGDSLTSPEFATRGDQVAEYIYRTSASTERTHVDHWRDMDTSKAVGANGLRTIGYSAVEGSLYDTVSEAAGSLCYALAQKWSGHGDTLPAELSESRALLQRLSLSEARLSGRIMSILRGEQGKQIEAWSKAKWISMTASCGGNLPTCEELAAMVDSDFENQADSVVEILSSVAKTMPQSATEASEAIRDFLKSLLDQPSRLVGASAAAMEIVTQLDSATNASERLLTEIDRSFHDLKLAIKRNDQTEEEIKTRCHQYCVVRFYRAIYNYFLEYVRATLKSARSTAVNLTELRSSMRGFATGFIKPGTVPASQPDLLVEAFDHHVMTNNQFCLAGLLEQDASIEDATAVLVRDAEAYLLANTDGGGTGSENRANRSFPESAKPGLLNVGGGRRVIAVLPADTPVEPWKKKLEAIFGDCVIVESTDTQTKLTVTCEIEGISIETLLDNFRHKNPRLMDVASRVHTRIDIDW